MDPHPLLPLQVALERYKDSRQASKDAVQPDGSKENSNKSINNDVQGMFNIWQAQSLGLDPIREERSSSDTNCSGNRKSLQRAPSGGGGLRHSIDVPSSVMEEQHGDFITLPSITSESHMLFWAANDLRGSVAYEPMYFEPPDVGGAGSASSLENGRAVHMDEVMEKRRNCTADATKPAGRLSFDAGRRTSVDLQPDHWTASCTEDGGDDDNVLITDPVARAAAAAVSCAVQARASFESARASFDQVCDDGTWTMCACEFICVHPFPNVLPTHRDVSFPTSPLHIHFPAPEVTAEVWMPPPTRTPHHSPCTHTTPLTHHMHEASAVQQRSRRSCSDTMRVRMGGHKRLQVFVRRDWC